MFFILHAVVSRLYDLLLKFSVLHEKWGLWTIANSRTVLISSPECHQTSWHKWKTPNPRKKQRPDVAGKRSKRKTKKQLPSELSLKQRKQFTHPVRTQKNPRVKENKRFVHNNTVQPDRHRRGWERGRGLNSWGGRQRQLNTGATFVR